MLSCVDLSWKATEGEPINFVKHECHVIPSMVKDPLLISYLRS